MDWEDILSQMDALEVSAKRCPYRKRNASDPSTCQTVAIMAE
jgi:hypothetical protein